MKKKKIFICFFFDGLFLVWLVIIIVYGVNQFIKPQKYVVFLQTKAIVETNRGDEFRHTEKYIEKDCLTQCIAGGNFIDRKNEQQ
jgi:hypothetical protein